MNKDRCPKCHYHRQAGDDHVHVGICPACGIAMDKWHAKAHDAVAPNTQSTDDAAPTLARAPSNFDWRATVMALPSRVDAASLYGRGGLWFGLLLWGFWFALHGIDWGVIGASFMHNINLPFHEFGHVLFMPFGRFMAILGGSLFQVLLPLGLAIAFVFQQRDNFAASVCLWWAGQSLVDLAPYIADAPLRALPLVGGAGESSHDWGNLLTMLGWMGAAGPLARFTFICGCATMLLASWWGLLLLRRQFAQSQSG